MYLFHSPVKLSSQEAGLTNVEAATGLASAAVGFVAEAEVADADSAVMQATPPTREAARAVETIVRPNRERR
jgi:hypothetical protein